eukprot:SAG31_NODE_5706_length_2369_cov_25.244934_4_plen_84_part_00
MLDGRCTRILTWLGRIYGNTVRRSITASGVRLHQALGNPLDPPRVEPRSFVSQLSDLLINRPRVFEPCIDRTSACMIGHRPCA